MKKGPKTSVIDRRTESWTDRVQTYSPLWFHRWGTYNLDVISQVFIKLSIHVHAKYEVSIPYASKVMTKVKVFCHRQTRQKLDAPEFYS